MKNLQNPNLILVDNTFITTNELANHTAGKFRSVIKTNLGYTIADARDFDNLRLMKYPESIISSYKKGTLQTVEFCPEGSDFYRTIFCRVGNKVKLIDETILAHLTVGTINSLYYSTNLYSQTQYGAVNSKSWADNAYIMNTIPELAL